MIAPLAVDSANALSAWAEGDEDLRSHLAQTTRLVVPVVVLGEYYFGIRQSLHRERYEGWLRSYLPTVEVATINHASAKVYATIRLELREAGRPIPANDAWIAALARQHQLPVLSQDARFDDVPDLRRISW